MAESLDVRLVAADREVWRGKARMVIARTTEGEIGVLPGHEPLLGVLVNGAVRITQEDGTQLQAAVHGGFLSISADEVAVLAEVAELAEEIDVQRARHALEQSQGQDESDDDVRAAVARAETRIAIAGAR